MLYLCVFLSCPWYFILYPCKVIGALSVLRVGSSRSGMSACCDSVALAWVSLVFLRHLSFSLVSVPLPLSTSPSITTLCLLLHLPFLLLSFTLASLLLHPLYLSFIVTLCILQPLPFLPLSFTSPLFPLSPFSLSPLSPYYYTSPSSLSVFLYLTSSCSSYFLSS